jgi:hypothetical protein
VCEADRRLSASSMAPSSRPKRKAAARNEEEEEEATPTQPAIKSCTGENLPDAMKAFLQQLAVSTTALIYMYDYETTLIAQYVKKRGSAQIAIVCVMLSSIACSYNAKPAL